MTPGLETEQHLEEAEPGDVVSDEEEPEHPVTQSAVRGEQHV